MKNILDIHFGPSTLPPEEREQNSHNVGEAKPKYYSPSTDTLSRFEIPGGVYLGIKSTPHGPNSSFKDGIQFAWDATSISLFKTCPRKYYYTVILGYVLRVTPPPLAFGIHLHTLFQEWYKLILRVDKHTALLRIVKLAGLLGETLPSGDTARSKESLVRTIVWYLDHFWDDKVKTIILPNDQPAVEHHFKLQIMEHLGILVYICGHIDRLVSWDRHVWACDYKSTKYALNPQFFAKFKLSTQIPLYVTATHITQSELSPTAHGAIIDGIQLGVNFTRFARMPISFSLEEIDEYILSLQYWIKQAMNACLENVFPPNEESCDKYGGCVFREICSKPPARREAFLKGHFTTQLWDPLRRR